MAQRGTNKERGRDEAVQHICHLPGPFTKLEKLVKKKPLTVSQDVLNWFWKGA